MSIDVLHLLPSLSLYGGTPRKVRDLIKHSLRTHGIYCWARWEADSLKSIFDAVLRCDGITVFQANYGWNFIRHLKDLVRIIDAQHVLVIHGYFETGLLLAAATKLMRPHVRAVVSFVGFPAPIGRVRRVALALLARKLDHIVYVSRFTRESFEAIYGFLHAVPSTIIYNGVGPRTALSHALKSQRYLQLLTVSALVPFKNVGLLLETIALLRETRAPEVRLFVVGDGPLRGALEQESERLGIGDCVEFVGYQEDVGAYLSVSHVYVHPSLREGFGLAVIEAMLQQLPVVVANAGALPELVEHGVTGMVVDPNSPRAWTETIRLLCNDSDLAKRLGEEGERQAKERFGVARFVREHEDLYRRLLVMT